MNLDQFQGTILIWLAYCWVLYASIAGFRRLFDYTYYDNDD